MRQTKKALPFVPSEFHASTNEDSKGVIGILSIHTTEGLLDIALDAARTGTQGPTAGSAVP
ncbi:conserved hypothetical protein [Mesorhizobium plurifarium]|uniref:Uncharacterized protein n=1 Tax=Mesorhizobium plurifarium TaxID=69974 RepID=A0A090GTH8_MESPL|nr:conserved hypothetical protein [Mesorhizobium plurifarium]